MEQRESPRFEKRAKDPREGCFIGQAGVEDDVSNGEAVSLALTRGMRSEHACQ